MNSIRLNIVLLPDPTTSQQAINVSSNIHSLVPTEFVLDNKTYYPHITIFQLHVPTKNLDRVYTEVEHVARTIHPFSMNTSNIRVSYGTFVFWSIQITPILKQLQADIITRTNSLREGLSMVDPSLLPHLTHADQQDAMTYGSLLIGPHYKPHITLTRLTNENDAKQLESLPQPDPTTIPVHALHIGTCGIHGTVNALLKTSEFI